MSSSQLRVSLGWQGWPYQGEEGQEGEEREEEAWRRPGWEHDRLQRQSAVNRPGRRARSVEDDGGGEGEVLGGQEETSGGEGEEKTREIRRQV